MSGSTEVMKKLNKDMGAVVQQGIEYDDVERIPTGVFPFDLAAGGGIPRGKISIIYGPESSGKTNLAMKAIASEQHRHAEEGKGGKCVFVDIENGYDPNWSAKLGVDNEELIYAQPKTAEQAVDLVEALMYAEDVSLIVVDSLAALATQGELDSSAEKARVGGNSVACGNLVRKAINAFGETKKIGQYPTLILINQIRHKIGVMFGNPEYFPGGNAVRHASSFTARIYGKNKMVNTVSAAIPTYKETSVVLNKWKVPIVSVNSAYEMAMLPTGKLQPGEVDDWNTVSNYAKDYGILTGKSGAWEIGGEVFKTLDMVKDKYWFNTPEGMLLRKELIEQALTVANNGPEEFQG